MTEELELTPKQELFCTYYTKNRELFGNATLAYAEAYDFGLDELSREQIVVERDDKGEPTKTEPSPYTRAYNVCSVNSSKLLRNPKIDAFIRKCMNELMKDDVIDAELMAIILNSEKDSDRVSAIKEYNKLKQRIIERTDLTTAGLPLILPAELISKNDPNSGTNTDSAGPTQV